MSLDNARAATAFRRHGVPAWKMAASAAQFPVWLIDGSVSGGEKLAYLLAPAERARAERFHSPTFRRRYIVAHAALRLLGEAYFDLPAALQVYRANKFGKPCLAEMPDLHCNISYGGEHAVVAWCNAAEIGIDIEPVRPIDDAIDLIQLHYTVSEQAKVMSVQQDLAAFSRAFLTVWVRKEACVKALGHGLSVPLTSIECGATERTTTVRAGVQLMRAGVIRSPLGHLVGWARCV